jgi:dTDP-glucose 4,6-dehydratase
MPVIIVRPFNTYGPRQSARAVIPTIITQIAAGAKTINLGSTSPTRDFSFVADTVDGFVSALENGSPFGQIINLGSNFEISIGDVVDIISKEMHSEIGINRDDIRLRPSKSEVERLWADNSKAQLVLNWKPKYSGAKGFQQGIQETVKWFTNPRNLELYKSNLYTI